MGEDGHHWLPPISIPFQSLTEDFRIFPSLPFPPSCLFPSVLPSLHLYSEATEFLEKSRAGNGPQSLSLNESEPGWGRRGASLGRTQVIPLWRRGTDPFCGCVCSQLAGVCERGSCPAFLEGTPALSYFLVSQGWRASLCTKRS